VRGIGVNIKLSISNQESVKRDTMKRIISFSIICLMFMGLVMTSSVYGADKVGYINLQRLVNESNMGKEARQNLQKMRQEKEAALKKKTDEYNVLKDYINNNAATMDEEDKKQKIEELRDAYKEYERLLTDAKEDIVREDKELVAIILKKADNVLKNVAKKNKYSIILKDSNAIGYLDPSADITDLVLQELNK